MDEHPDWSALSDEELAAYCVTRLEGAMEELLARYDRRVRSCARRMALGRDEVEDLVQETFLRVVASLPRYEGTSAFSTWLYRLAHNTCVDSFRRGTRQRAHRSGGREQELLEEFLADGDADDWGDPEAALEHDLAACYVGWLLSTLSPDNRRVVELRLLEGRSTEEVARLLGTTEDGVKSRLRRARAQLRGLVEGARPCPFCGYRYEPPQPPRGVPVRRVVPDGRAEAGGHGQTGEDR
jgi:RNA polymerase sigma-70 factor (ECF subfamily)